MCERRYTPAVMAELQQIGLECAIKRLLASRCWQIVRQAYPGGSDADVLEALVRYEALRVALRSEAPIFDIEEFAR